MVTPIQKALDIIDSEELVKERKGVERDVKERHGRQTLDFDSPEDATKSEYEWFEELTRKLVNTPKQTDDESEELGEN